MTGMAVLGYLFVIGRSRTLLVLLAVVRRRRDRSGRIGRYGMRRQRMRKLAEHEPAQQERDDQPAVSIRTIHAKKPTANCHFLQAAVRRSEREVAFAAISLNR